MTYTFKELRDQVLRFLGEDGDTVTDTMVKDVMNQAQANRLGQHAWPFMRYPSAATITVVAGTQRYSLHQEYGRGISFYNETLGRAMNEIPWRETLYEAENYDDTTDSATPLDFQIAGTQQVKTQLSSNQTVKIVSSSASDASAAKAVTVTGETASGDITSESITPNGLTAAAGTITWARIDRVTKAADWVGTMSLKAADDTVLTTLYPTENGRTYRVFELLVSPSEGATIRYRFFRKVLFMENDADVSQLPDDHALLLVFDTLLLLVGALRTVPSGAMKAWEEMQQRLERNLYREYGFDQSTLNAKPTYINYTGDY